MADISLLIRNNPKLSNINPLKLRLLTEISEKSKGRNIEEMLPEIMMINKELSKRNLSFTKDESELLLDIMMQDMDEDQKKKLNMMKQFFT